MSLSRPMPSCLLPTDGKEGKARAQDWNVKEVLRGPEALCHLLDDAKSPPGPCFCQVKSNDEWTEA